jgi:hypothetical protein
MYVSLSQDTGILSAIKLLQVTIQLLNKQVRARKLSPRYSFKTYAAEPFVTVILLKHILQTSIHS